jgi:hypothetical protein
MKLIIFCLMFTLYSCKQQQRLVVTELNTVGKVIKIQPCKKCLDGSYVYYIELDSETHKIMKYITDCTYNIGDNIYFQTLIKKETYN